MQVFSNCPILLERVPKCDGELFLSTNISNQEFCDDAQDFQIWLEAGPGLRYARKRGSVHVMAVCGAT